MIIGRTVFFTSWGLHPLTVLQSVHEAKINAETTQQGKSAQAMYNRVDANNKSTLYSPNQNNYNPFLRICRCTLEDVWTGHFEHGAMLDLCVSTFGRIEQQRIFPAAFIGTDLEPLLKLNSLRSQTQSYLLNAVALVLAAESGSPSTRWFGLLGWLDSGQRLIEMDQADWTEFEHLHEREQLDETHDTVAHLA
eukprot:3862583-Amphidinium_carterae.1